MKFRTTVENEMKGLDIHPGDGLTLLGSCFADHIGRRMVQSGLDAHANPFGVLYNPLSIAAWCRAMATGEPLPEDIFFESGGLWHSWLNDSFFSAENREECSFIWDNYYYEDEKINEYDLSLFIETDKDSGLYRKYEETHYQRAYTLEEMKELIRKSGLEFVTAYDAFSKNAPMDTSERIYVIAREQGK